MLKQSSIQTFFTLLLFFNFHFLLIKISYACRIVLMPETVAEKIYSFEAREFKEGQLIGKIGKISSEEISCIIPDGIMTMKFVMSYYILREI